MAHAQPLSAYAKACRKINDSYQAEIKKSAWMSAAIGALGPVTSAGIMVTLGVTGGALVPVTGPAILAVTAAYSVVGGIWKFAQRRGEAVKQRDNGLFNAAGNLGGPLETARKIDGMTVAHFKAVDGTLSREDLDRTYWMADKNGRTVAQVAKDHGHLPEGFDMKTMGVPHSQETMNMNTETAEAQRTRPATLADMDPSAKDAHMNDAHIMAHVTMVREDMGKLSREMEAFNRHPDVVKASQNAEKYGMPQVAALHQALDQNPKLKDAFVKVHDRAMAIQPKVENAMEMAQGLSPKHSGTAEATLQHGLEGIQKQGAHWPNPTDIGAQNSNTAKGQPGLVAMTGHLLKKLKETFTGKKHKDELEHGHTATASPLEDKGAVKPTATESPVKPAEPAAGRPTIRRKP